MENETTRKEFELPLELQFAMRKAELQTQEMCWDELQAALLNLYFQRMMEWEAVKEIMCSEGIDIDWDLPSELELSELALACMQDESDDDDDLNYAHPFSASSNWIRRSKYH